ncbi:MAG: LuxR C-terminal-related transcriptional regulator [Nevskia sp.]|nr:LuxR C-terminal-related transcriptional regulator [Nevskia sp.]
MRIDALIDALKRAPGPLSLFLDNLQSCTDAALGRLIDCLCFHTRGDVELVFSSNRELPFDVSRARLEGLLWPITASDLGFDAGEVAALLGPPLCAAIGAEGVEQVTARTEGWPAAVRMAPIILSQAEQPKLACKDFSGSDEALAQLLNRQVLSGFTDGLREFLYCLAQLRIFSVELCVQAIGGADVNAHLACLIERNVFVIPLDQTRSRYRLHGLIRDHLRHEAGRLLSAERRQGLLIRAAGCCEKSGDWRDAVDYALASGSSGTASQILEQIAPSFVRDRGDVLQYIRWLDALHTQGRQAGPEAEYWFAWALAFHRRYDDARKHSAALASRVQRLPAASHDRDLQRRIAILRTSIDSLTDHLDDALARCQRLAERSRRRPGRCFQPHHGALHRQRLSRQSGIVGTMALVAARAAVGMGLSEEARVLLDAGLRESRTHGFLEAAACGLEAAVLLGDGVQPLGLLREIAAAYPPRLSLMLSCFLARRLVRLGRIEDAKAEAARIGITIDAAGRQSRTRPSPGIALSESLIAAVRIELLIASNRHPQATLLIAEELRRAKADDCAARQVELALDSAAIAVRADHPALAVRPITRAVTLSASRRIVRPFDDHIDTLSQVIAATRASAWGFASDDERRFFADCCRRLPAADSQAQARIVALHEAPRLLGNPTPRELELLGYIDAGLSNQQLADRSDVSLTTIKRHLHNLYGKLGVSSRSAALAKARVLKLLAR